MPAGWRSVLGSPLAHYVGEDGWSACRRFGPAPVSDDPPEASCGACRKVAALGARLGPVERVEMHERAEPPAWTPPPGPRPPRKRRGRRA